MSTQTSQSSEEALMTHYDILQVPPTASYETIKMAYQTAARAVHPDKRPRGAITTSSDDDNDSSFLRLQKAWECLRDTQARKEYDNQLLQQHRHSNNSLPLVAEDWELVEEEDTGDLLYVYQCRCGQELWLSQSDFEKRTSTVVSDCTTTTKPTVLLPCDGCSLQYHLAVDI